MLNDIDLELVLLFVKFGYQGFTISKINSDTVSPSISHEGMGPDAMIFVF